MFRYWRVSWGGRRNINGGRFSCYDVVRFYDVIKNGMKYEALLYRGGLKGSLMREIW